MTEEEKKPRYNPASGNMWYEFMHATIALDNNHKDKKPRGYHWFWGLYFIKDKLPDFDLTEIKKELPNEHWLKEAQIPILSKDLDDLTQKLIKRREHIFEGRKFTIQIDSIDFSGLDFQQSIANSTLDFEKTGDFSEFIFPIKTSFDRSRLFPAKFENAVFFNSVSFISVDFCGQAIFENAVFFKRADFMITKFRGEANFRKAIFAKDASFNSSVFSGIALFYQVIFAGKITVFNDTTFSSNALFFATNFFGITYFNNAKFLTYTNFKLSRFDKHAPQFYGATFNNEMVWTGINLPKFKKINDKESKIEYDERIQRNQDAYENLATKLDDLKKYHDQHFFFRQETRCRQELAESFFSLCAFWLYEFFSDYGYRIGRVFGWWLGHIALGAVVIAFIAMCGGMRFHESLPCAIPVSFANANPYTFFGFESSNLKACYTELDKLAPISFAIVKAIQTAFGIALLSLLIITLRTRFRLK